MLPHCYQDSPIQYDPSRSVFSKSSFFGSIGSCGVGSVGTGRIRNAARSRAWTAVTFGRITKGRVRHPLHDQRLRTVNGQDNPHLHMLRFDQAAVKQSP
jgi:hypothetical protein